MMAAARMEYVEVAPNVRLHVRDWGEGTPVVMIPGWPLSDAMYDYQMLFLAENGFRPVSITQRGFGTSDKPWGAYDYDVYADDLRIVLQALDLHDVVLCGHSMGGAVAIHYLARHQGQRVAKLALFGAAAPSWTQDEDYPYGLKVSEANAFIQMAQTDRPRLFTNFGKIFGLSEASISPGHAAWLHAQAMEASPYAVQQSLIALRDSDLRLELSAVTVPTLILHATRDRVCPFVFARELNRGIRDSRVIPYENSGHGLFVEEMEKFNRELMDFAGAPVAARVGAGAGR